MYKLPGGPGASATNDKATLSKESKMRGKVSKEREKRRVGKKRARGTQLLKFHKQVSHIAAPLLIGEESGLTPRRERQRILRTIARKRLSPRRKRLSIKQKSETSQLRKYHHSTSRAITLQQRRSGAVFGQNSRNEPVH